ncbi:MAG: CocE/NonD family hydrolase [Clostridia bacterium]|nr:CocE/NonD family hydrolase [Clostridia bacterium]
MSVRVYDLMLPMPDGVWLYTRVLLPGEGRYPTVFQRTTYDAQAAVTPETVRAAENNPFIRRGYAVVQQHCRGSFGSEGACIPYAPEERRDGLDTLTWIRTLPHYNGELYLSGGSYTASVLLMLLDEPIPDLKALSVTAQTESMYHRNYFNGMCRSFCGFTWWLAMIARQHPTIAQDKDIFVRPYRDIMKRAIGQDLPAFTEELLHDRFDAFWRDDPRIGVMEKLRVPILMTSGWFDYYCYGMCSMWEKLAPQTRARSCFLMTPYGHDLCLRAGSEYPLTHGAPPADREAAWFDAVRLGRPFPYGTPGSFRYYMIGEDRWYAAAGPYENEPTQPLYLTADGAMTARPPRPGRRTYIYDPERPLHHDRHDYMFLCDEAHAHADVLSFVSEPFEQAQAFFGPVAFHVQAASDCDDTAFFFRLYLVEDGKAYNLVDAVTTLLHAAPDYRAGESRTLHILSQPTAFRVRPGCRLRVDISSFSDCFVPHANTAEPFALARTTRVARNTVFCGDSAVLLPRKKDETGK